MPKKENVRQMFDHIASDYDKLNHILSLGIDRSWRRKAVKKIADLPQGASVLDIACGTGDFSIAIARKLPGNGSVTGVDLSEGMLQVGVRKVAEAGLSGKIRFEQGDCESLRFKDGSFDRVSVAFGVRNFEHLEQGLREMRRVLKPGGRLVILELSVPGNRVLRWLYELYFLHVLPVIGGWVSGDKGAYRYLPASVLKFPKPEVFCGIMRDCGFERVSARGLTFGICRLYIGEV